MASRHQVEVEVVHRLSRGGTVVYGYPESGIWPEFLAGNCRCDMQQTPKQRLIGLCVGVEQRRKMRLGNDEDVPGCNWPDVVERRDGIVLIHQRHTRLARSNVAKNAALGQR